MRLDSRKHKLRKANKPQEGYQLSGVVKVDSGEDKFNAYIRFSESFIDAVGHKMPRGVSVDDPCYLTMEKNTATKEWYLFGKYLYTGEKVLLKVYRELPGWIRLKGPKNGNKSAQGKSGA